MQKGIELAKKIAKSLDQDHRELLSEFNYHNTLGAIYAIPNVAVEDHNRIICFIIYAYTPNNLWLDLKKDRMENKRKILDSLGANLKLEIFKDVLHGSSDIVGMCIFNYLEELKDWRWPVIFDLLDWSGKMRRFSGKDTESEIKWDEMNKSGEKETFKQEVDINTIISANEKKGKLLDMAIAKRKQADEMTKELEKDYVETDTATQSDFGFKFTDTPKKRDILSWRQFINERNLRKATMPL
jgi:hypothetical protein